MVMVYGRSFPRLTIPEKRRAKAMTGAFLAAMDKCIVTMHVGI
jgi:hypothetical protein